MTPLDKQPSEQQVRLWIDRYQLLITATAKAPPVVRLCTVEVDATSATSITP
jgi:hypothetical protein